MQRKKKVFLVMVTDLHAKISGQYLQAFRKQEDHDGPISLT